MESKKLGRPTTDPKINTLKIRLSDGDIKKLEYCQKELKQSKADIVRMGIETIYTSLQKA